MTRTWQRALCALAAAAVQLCCTAAFAQAESAKAGGSGAAMLEIAADYAGPGMDRPYQEGYMPDVTQEAADIVLPLRPVGDMEEAPENISVSVSLGDPSSPFVFQNYDMQVPLAVPEGWPDPLYLVRLSVPLEDPHDGGRFPVVFDCRFGSAGGLRSQTFTVFVTVPASLLVPFPPDDDGLPAAEPGSDDSPDAAAPDTGTFDPGGSSGAAPAESKPPQQPKFLLTSCSVSPSPVVAGEPFSVNLTLQNTSSVEAAANLLVTAEGDGTDIFPQDGSGNFYAKKVGPGETFSMQIPMASSPEAKSGLSAVTLHAGYDGPQGTAYTQDETITVQTTQPVRFSVDEVLLPAAMQAGDTLSIPVNVMNLGRGAIRNVAASAEAPGVRVQSTLFLGNMDSGTAKQGTLYAFVSQKSDEEGQARYGKTEGTLTVACEDEFGTTYVQEQPFSLVIEAPVQRSAPPKEEEEPEEAVFPWQYSLAVTGGIAAGAAVLWRVRRSRERKRHAAS